MYLGDTYFIIYSQYARKSMFYAILLCFGAGTACVYALYEMFSMHWKVKKYPLIYIYIYIIQVQLYLKSRLY